MSETNTTRLLKAVAVAAMGASALAAQGEAKKKKPAPAATAAPAAASAPIVQAPAPQPTPAQKFAQGETYADANYEKLLPPLPAQALVGPDRSPPQQQGGFHIGLGGTHTQNPTEGLISGVAKELDTFVKTAKELQEKSAFTAGGDPYQNGVNVESARIFSLTAQDEMNKFKQITALEQFLTQSDRHDIAMKVAIPARGLEYTPAYKVDPKAAAKMLQDTIDQAEGLALGLRTSIGEYKSAQKNGGILGNLSATIKNGGRTQNRVFTGDEANKANFMSARLKQTEAAFAAMLGLPGASGPANPYATPATQEPANPYSPAAQPQAQPAPPTPPHSDLRAFPRPGEKQGTIVPVVGS